MIVECNGVGSGMAWTKSYIYLGGRLLATESPLSLSTTETKYQHPDRLGTRLVTSSAGAVVSENISLPFGATISSESLNLAGSATKKRFTSYDRSDTTKLDYAVNRHYSSAQGRFTQVDPIGMSATQLEDPQSLNLYAYVGNDPINYTDPSGLFSFKNLIGSIYRGFAKVAAVILVVAVVIALSMSGPAAPGAMMIFKMVLGAVKFAIDGWNNGNKFLQYVSAGIGAYLGFSVGGSMAKTNPIFGGASGAIIGAVSAFVQTTPPARLAGPIFQSIQKAAIFALQSINRLSIKTNAEYSGAICEDNRHRGNYRYTDPRRFYRNDPVGNPNNRDPREYSPPPVCPNGTTIRGWYHTHAAWSGATANGGTGITDGNEVFSVGDIANNNRLQVQGWLATPTRRIYRLNPGQGYTDAVDVSNLYGRTPR